METCRNCEFFVKDDSDEQFFIKHKLDGFCELIECGVKADEHVCKSFTEKED